MLRRYVIGIIILQATFWVAQPAVAHDAEVVTTGRKVDLIGDSISASEGVVGQSELSIRPILRVGEILEAVPGMVATQHSGSGKANQYFLRGFNLDHGTDFATWYDGMPVNMRTHGHGQGYTDLNFIIPELIQNISFKKGSYYAEIGDFSAAGAAHFSSFDSLDEGMVELGVGQDNYGRLLMMDTPDNAQQWLYALELHRYDGPWTDVEEDLEKINAVVKRHWEIGGGMLSMSLMAYDNSWNAPDQIPQRAVREGLIDELGSIDASLGGESSRYSLSMKWTKDQWRSSLYVIDYDLNIWSNFTYFLDDPDNGDQFEQVDTRKIYGGQIVRDFGHKIKNTTGIEFRIDDIDEVGLYKTAMLSRVGAVRADAVEESSVGLFWQSVIPLTSTIKASLGMRYDHFNFDVKSLIDENFYGVSLAANSGSLDDGLFSVKGNLSYLLTDEVEVYISAGQGLHSNDARGSTIEVDPISGDQIEKVDPLVRSTGAEVGTRTFISDKINASFALWMLTLDSELLFVGDAGNTEATRKSERNGFEATIYYNFTETFSVDFEYARANSSFKDPDPNDPSLGDRIPGALDNVISMGLNFARAEGWYGSLRWRYLGERALDENASVKADKASIFNLRAGYQWEKVKLTLDWLNLFDSDAHDIDYLYSSRLPGEPSEGVEDIHYHVIEPRTIRVALQYQF